MIRPIELSTFPKRFLEESADAGFVFVFVEACGGSPVVYDNAKARRILRWQAQYTFDKWFAALAD